MFTHLGIPQNKMLLLKFKDYYNLEKSNSNFVIIALYDYKIKALTIDYRNKNITFTTYKNRVNSHLNEFYNLRYGNKLKTLLREIIH